LKRAKTSIIVSIIVIASSFVPVIHILAALLNGMFLHPFSGFVKEGWSLQLINLIPSIIALYFFYTSKTLKSKLFSLLSVLIFFLPFLMYNIVTHLFNHEFWYVEYLIVGIIFSATVISLEIKSSFKV
jgi:hypothetical protein